MAISLNHFLTKALQPTSHYPPIQEGKYRWSYANKEITYQEIDPSRDEADSLVRIYSIMNKQLKSFNSLASIPVEEKNELIQLKNLVKIHQKKFDNKERGFFEKIYLLFKHLFNPSLDKISGKVIAKIDKLYQKPTTPDVKNLDTFLKLVAPISQHLAISIIPGSGAAKWVYDPLLGVIKDVEDDATEPVVYEDLQMILTEMSKQLSAIKREDKLTGMQTLQIQGLKFLVNLRTQDHPELDEIKRDVLQKIDELLTAPVITPELIEVERLNGLSSKVVEELYLTELKFLSQIETSIVQLKILNDLSKDPSLECPSKFERFFRSQKSDSNNKAYLDECITAFETLGGYAKQVSDEFDVVMNLDNIHERNEALAVLYEGDLFKDYSKSASVCARYYNVLSEFEREIKKRGEDYWKPYLNVKAGDKIVAPTDFYSPAFQRPMRHPLLMLELLKNTPSDSESYVFIYSCYTNALSYSVDVDKRVNHSFTA